MNSFLLWAMLGLVPFASAIDGSRNGGCPQCDCCGCCETGKCGCKQPAAAGSVRAAPAGSRRSVLLAGGDRQP